jgi:hypothetical protein
MTADNRLLTWTPRILGIGFALFTSIFALDAFGEGSLVQNIIAFLMHLIPTFIILAIALVAFRREMVGAVGFLALAVLYIVIFWGRFPIGTYVIMAGPLAIAGVLFMASWTAHHQQ